MFKHIYAKESPGKTVKAVSKAPGHLLMSFEDGTFMVLEAVDDHEIDRCYEFRDVLEAGNISDALAIAGGRRLVATGIATQEEVDEYNREREAIAESIKEESDRAEYARLKAKYEGQEQTS